MTKTQQLLQLDQCAASIAGRYWTGRSAHPELSLAEQLLRVAHGSDTDAQPGLESIDVQAPVNLARQAQSVERGRDRQAG